MSQPVRYSVTDNSVNTADVPLATCQRPPGHSALLFPRCVTCSESRPLQKNIPTQKQRISDDCSDSPSELPHKKIEEIRTQKNR